MSGTIAGGRLVAEKCLAKYGADFYKRIGAMGGRKGHTGGFYVDREMARLAGTLGGKISTREKQKRPLSERQRIRREFEKNYAHLLKVNRQSRQRAMLS